jgi:hypothetical protein
VLWWRFGVDADVSVNLLPAILAGGVVNDLVQSLYLTAPLALFIMAIPDRRYRSRFMRGVMPAAVAFGIGLLIYLAIVENYFEEFDALCRRGGRLPDVSDRSGRRHLGSVSRGACSGGDVAADGAVHLAAAAAAARGT